MNIINFLKFLIILAMMPTGALAGLSLPGIFSDHMVLQREQEVPVWGDADPGATIKVQFANQTKTTKADDEGFWRVELEPLTASALPRVLEVSAIIGGESSDRQFTNVLVGDVWLCSGQSNMEWSMSQSENSAAAIANANYPLIRLYKTPRAYSRSPLGRIDSQWTECSPQSVSNFSAVAYYFGRSLHEEVEIPIGLLQSARGGSRIEPWTPPSGFEGFDSLASIRQKVGNFPDDYGTDPEKANHEIQYPTALFNAMLHAHIPFAIKGVIWYQGESNHNDGMLYLDKTAALLQGWRGLWGYDFPFYFVQIAPFLYGQDDPERLAEFWEAQGEVVKQIPHTGMAVIHDATTLDNIHPPNKEIPGTRLARLALDHTYGRDIVSSGPTFDKMVLRDGKIIVQFTSAEGLTTRDGEAPDWFEIAGDDGIFKPAGSRIKENRIVLSSPEVRHPLAMRFGWNKLATPNLMNAAGLPAPAFRAGKLP